MGLSQSLKCGVSTGSKKEHFIGTSPIITLFIVVITVTQNLRFAKKESVSQNVFSLSEGKNQVPFIANWFKKGTLVASLLEYRKKAEGTAWPVTGM